jgi:hypothetical protein
MRPIEFKHQNVVYAKDQPQYQPLPALKLRGEEGEVISCWRMSFKERLKVLFTGRMWVSLLSFNQPLTPSYLSVNRKEMYYHPDDKHRGIFNRMNNEINPLFIRAIVSCKFC